MKKQVEWMHKPANINVADYQDELLALSKHVLKDFDNLPDMSFKPVWEHIGEFCPKLLAKIDEWGLSNRLGESALIILSNGGKYEIHRDFPMWKIRNIALNIPVLNCDDTYTVFYDAKFPEEHKMPTVGDTIYARHSEVVEEETAVEIDRCPSNRANWINVFQPHAPLSTHNLPRIMFSIRFKPELFDYIDSGYFDQHMVKHD